MSKVLIATGEFGESLEVYYCYYRLKEEGIEPVIAAPNKKRLQLVVHDFEPDYDAFRDQLPGRRPRLGPCPQELAETFNTREFQSGLTANLAKDRFDGAKPSQQLSLPLAHLSFSVRANKLDLLGDVLADSELLEPR